MPTRHGHLTWNDIQTRILEMSYEELSQDATIQIASEEFIAVQGWGKSKDGDSADGILDSGHLYLIPLGMDVCEECSCSCHCGGFEGGQICKQPCNECACLDE